MGLENGKWRVQRGDCLYNIARSVYGNGSRWKEIAGANGLPQSGNPIIYPNQLLTIPGVTPSSTPVNPPSPPPPPPITRPRIDWFALQAGSERDMLAIWSYNANNFHIRWEQWDNNGHLLMLNEQTNVSFTDQAKQSIGTGKDDEGYGTVIRFSVRPCDNDGNHLPNTDWVWQEYDFKNNPPQLPPEPTFSINSQNQLTVTVENIEEKINADSIEVAIYQDDTTKYSTAKVTINREARFAKYMTTVPAGHTYKVRCRAVRGNVYGGWTNFSGSEQASPIAPDKITTLRPQVISEQGAKQYGIFIEWPEEKTAKTYEVQWATKLEYFDISENVSSQTTEEGKGPRLLITNIELGHEYFFRVRSINDKGPSLNWTVIKSVKLGSRPSAPTTWSNTTSAIMGEDLNLYWTHNATDGSLESYARLHITVIDSAHPDREPMEYDKVIRNTKPEEEQHSNSVYRINTNDSEWSNVENGFIIKWKVQTAGVIGEYSEWSVEREVNVYVKPALSLELQGQNGVSIEEVNTFPFYFSVLATPATQIPISYYVEVIANSGYDIVDEVGNLKTINPGDKVYQKYYDPEQNAWRFLVEMTPGNIDLKSGVNYTVNCTVSMDSGLTAIGTQSFNVAFPDVTAYDVYADVLIDKETLTANIHPYCNEYTEKSDGTFESVLSKDCSLAVFRREYNGTFTEIESNINNEQNFFITDPHPALDYARYRIVAKSNKTGAITYADVVPVKVGEPAIVIQWGEKWTKFEYDESGNGNVEPNWAGSMLKLPYNVDTSENNNKDVSLIKYAGRKHPVSYYGTQIGESASWNCEVPREDTETIYALRRLSIWMDNVYVREPSGTGYWANISVSFNLKHLGVTIPVSFDIKRVEGGI